MLVLATLKNRVHWKIVGDQTLKKIWTNLADLTQKWVVT